MSGIGEGRPVTDVGRHPGSGRPSSPSRPASVPTDAVGRFWVEGTVTRAGDGPCFGLRTRDGRELALYTRASIELVQGGTARMLVSPASFRLDCGPGELMRLLEVDPGDRGQGGEGRSVD